MPPFRMQVRKAWAEKSASLVNDGTAWDRTAMGSYSIAPDPAAPLSSPLRILIDYLMSFSRRVAQLVRALP